MLLNLPRQCPSPTLLDSAQFLFHIFSYSLQMPHPALLAVTTPQGFSLRSKPGHPSLNALVSLSVCLSDKECLSTFSSCLEFIDKVLRLCFRCVNRKYFFLLLGLLSFVFLSVSLFFFGILENSFHSLKAQLSFWNLF